MQISVILAHPDSRSFNHSIAIAATEEQAHQRRGCPEDGGGEKSRFNSQDAELDPRFRN
jgi:putative NADPH-quinone reductase